MMIWWVAKTSCGIFSGSPKTICVTGAWLSRLKQKPNFYPILLTCRTKFRFLSKEVDAHVVHRILATIIITQFQFVFFLVIEGGRIHLIPSAIALTPSLHLVRSAASSISNPTFFTLYSTCLLPVIFCRPRFRCPFTSSIIAFFSYIVVISSNHMSIPSYSIHLCHSIQRFLQTQHLHQLGIDRGCGPRPGPGRGGQKIGRCRG